MTSYTDMERRKATMARQRSARYTEPQQRTPRQPLRQLPARYAPEPDEDEWEDERVTTRSRAVAQPRYHAHYEAPPRRETTPRRYHWLFWVGIVLSIIFIGWLIINALSGVWTNTYNNLTYGYPRISQVDMAVGHHDSAANPSHFIAMNLNGHIEVEECPGGNCVKNTVYLIATLTSPGATYLPVTLQFTDLTGNGRLDMVVTYGDTSTDMINTGSAFAFPKP